LVSRPGVFFARKPPSIVIILPHQRGQKGGTGPPFALPAPPFFAQAKNKFENACFFQNL
jgi:hypothetical protein